MECHLEADPAPEVRWHHTGTQILPSPRVTISLDKQSGSLYKATLVIKVCLSLYSLNYSSLNLRNQVPETAVHTNARQVTSWANLMPTLI